MIASAVLCALISLPLGDVFTVGPTPQFDYPELQVAIDLAPPGAELRLSGGLYDDAYLIDGKSLTVVASPETYFEGTLEVTGLGTDQTVIVRGIHFRESPGPVSVQRSLTIHDSEGLVYVEECEVERTGASVVAAGVVVFNETAFSGGYPALTVGATDFLHVHASSCRGSTGGTAAVVSGASGSAAYFGGSVCRGGNGANNNGLGGAGGDGGDGLVKIGSGHDVMSRNTTLAGGYGGSGGHGGICGSCMGPSGDYGASTVGSVARWDGVEPELVLATEVAPGQGLMLTVDREVGDEVFVSFMSAVTPQNVPGQRGILFSNYVGPLPGHPDWQHLGTLGSSPLTATVQIPASAISAEGLTYVQTAHLDTTVDRWLYGPLRAVAVRLPVPAVPDAVVSLCNGDGGDSAGCTDCPVSNNSATGTIGGCRNWSHRSARLFVSGSHSISLPAGSSEDLRFSVRGAPDESFCRLFSGSGIAPGNPANPCFGMDSGVQSSQFRGLRCAINNLRRHGGRPADSDGNVGLTNNAWGGESAPMNGIARASGFVAGQTRYFQVIYRDGFATCCPGLNTTQAIRLTLTP